MGISLYGMEIGEEQVRAWIDGHHARNRQLAEKIAAKGESADEPRPVDLHFWAWNQRDAALLAKSLYDRGFLVLELGPALGYESRWTVKAGMRMPVRRIVEGSFTEDMVRLALEHTCEYDGWGAKV